MLSGLRSVGLRSAGGGGRHRSAVFRGQGRAETGAASRLLPPSAKGGQALWSGHPHATQRTGVQERRACGTGLLNEAAAVRAGLTLVWSNSPTEGFVHRLTWLKRQADGRAGVAVFRHRILATPPREAASPWARSAMTIWAVSVGDVHVVSPVCHCADRHQSGGCTVLDLGYRADPADELHEKAAERFVQDRWCSTHPCLQPVRRRVHLGDTCH